MGRPNPLPQYTPPPSTITDDGISLYTQQSEDDINDTPPAYYDAAPSSSSSSSSQPLLLSPTTTSSSPTATRPPRKHATASCVRPVPFRTSPELELLMDPHFDVDPVYAEDMVREWASIPPKQMIRIVGTHRERADSKAKPDATVVDFDVEVPLFDYLVNGAANGDGWSALRVVENVERVHRGTVWGRRGPVPPKRRRGRALGDEEELDGLHVEEEYPKLSLTAWMHLYCAAGTPLKSFRISRTVSGLDTNYLHDALQAIISSTNYRGHTRITFPISNRCTEVHSTHFLNTLRFNTWIRLFCYVTFLWLLTWPYLFLTTRKWAVVRVDWPFSRVSEEDGVREYMSLSEAEWVLKWGRCVEEAVLGRKKGALTMQDLIRFEMPRGGEGGGFRSGSAAVDRVVGVFGAAIRGAREVRRQWGWGGDC